MLLRKHKKAYYTKKLSIKIPLYDIVLIYRLVEVPLNKQTKQYYIHIYMVSCGGRNEIRKHTQCISNNYEESLRIYRIVSRARVYPSEIDTFLSSITKIEAPC